MIYRNTLGALAVFLATIKKPSTLPKSLRCAYHLSRSRTAPHSNRSTANIPACAHRPQSWRKKLRNTSAQTYLPVKTLAHFTSGHYDPSVVSLSLFRVVTDTYGQTIPHIILQALKEHFEASPEKVNSLAESIYDYLSDSYPEELDSVPFVVVNMFRTYASTASILASGPLDDLIASASQSTESASLIALTKMLRAYGEKRKTFLDLYCRGVGRFLPELQTLTKEFDFSTLSNISPVLTKVSGLVSDLDAYIAERGETRPATAKAIRLSINVMRYRKLYDSLVSRSTDKSLPSNLLSITRDADAKIIQKHIASLSAEKQKLDRLILSNQNMFNVVYVSIGFDSLDTIFAFLNGEAGKNIYTPVEKRIINEFVDTFMPLAYDGLLELDVLRQPQYEWLLVKNGNDMIVPFKISENIFDNYELSLAILFRVPSLIHLVRLVKPEISSASEPLPVDVVLTAIREYFSSSSPLLKADAQDLNRLIADMNSHFLRGPMILQMLAQDLNLNLVALNQHGTKVNSPSSKPHRVDLLPGLDVAASSAIRTANCSDFSFLTGFESLISNFRLIDLNNERYADIGVNNFLRYLEKRLRFLAADKHTWEASAVNSKNAEQYVQLYENLAQFRDVVNVIEPQLDKISDAASESTHSSSATKSDYAQIPDDLKLHDLHAEIEIFRTDELKLPYAFFSLQEIIDRLKSRTDELMKDDAMTLNSSRMTPKNVLWFRKLLSRMKLLFAMNGGNTEVLDALVRSQDVFAKLEAKIKKSKKVTPISESDGSQALGNFSGPYLQIPEDLQLHEFVSKLVAFKENDLSTDFKNWSPEKILLKMKTRIDEILKGNLSTKSGLAINKDNFREYISLHSKINKLFILNGGYTAILDTMIDSVFAFDAFESKIAAKRATEKKGHISKLTYLQLPEEMILEDYHEELLELKLKVGSPFAKLGAETVLATLEHMIDEENQLEKKIVLGKLFYNLKTAFKLNNNHTSILDNVILSAENFSRVDQNIRNSTASKTNLTRQIAPSSADVQINDDNEYVLSLLMNQNDTPSSDTELNIESALSNAMHAKANKDLDQDDTYSESVHVPEALKRKPKDTATKNDTLDKEKLEMFLKKAKSENESKLERQRRERKAYEWSSSMVNRKGSLENGRFFGPLFSKSTGFPMFPLLSKRQQDFLVLTSKGTTVTSPNNPLGDFHVQEDLFDILERLSEAELQDFSKSLKKLQKQGWKIIGCRNSGNGHSLVLSRRLAQPKLWPRMKSMFWALIVVVSTVVGLNYWLECKLAEKEAIHEKFDKNESGQSQSTGPDKGRLNFSSIGTDDSSDRGEVKTSWRLILWR